MPVDRDRYTPGIAGGLRSAAVRGAVDSARSDAGPSIPLSAPPPPTFPLF